MGLSQFWRDWAERVFWTSVQVVLAVVIAGLADLKGEYVPVIAAGLAALKGLVARKIGDPNSAAIK